MEYDPVKRSLGKFFNKAPLLRKLFYKLLDILLLRAWYIKREIKVCYKTRRNDEISFCDAGAGFGQYSYFVSGYLKKSKIEAVDVKQEQIDDCNSFFTKIKRNDRVKFEYADLTQYVKPQSFDMVLSVDVMEHILEDEKVFANISKSLKQGGNLLISTPSDLGGSDVHDKDDESFISEHVRDGYNIDDIKRKLLKAGFSKVEAKYSYGKPGSIAWFLSMKLPIILLSKSMILLLSVVPYYILFYPLCLVLNFIDLHTSHASGTGLIVKAVK